MDGWRKGGRETDLVLESNCACSTAGLKIKSSNDSGLHEISFFDINKQLLKIWSVDKLAEKDPIT